jgi:ankyrin repeat protein
VVAVLIEAGAEVERREASGRTALVLAAMSDSPEVLRLLIAVGAQIDARETGTGNTALMLAANRGYLEVLRILIAAGAEIGAVAEDGWTALQAAEMIGDDEAAALLRAAGAR